MDRVTKYVCESYSIFLDPFENQILNTFTYNSFLELEKGDIELLFIPNGVTHLFFGFSFDKKLKKGDISNSVTHLTFGSFLIED